MNRANRNRIPFPHPGETLREDYLKPLDMSVNKLALELRVRAAGITADTALPLARYFNTTPKSWLNLQSSYDLEEIAKTVHPRESS